MVAGVLLLAHLVRGFARALIEKRPKGFVPGLTQILYLVRANRPDCVDK